MPNAEPQFAAASRPTGRGRRWFASWNLWLVLLFVGLALIAAAVCIPTLQRMEAIRYLKDHNVQVEISPQGEWLTEWLGEFGTARRSVRNIVCVGALNDRILREVALLGEVQTFHCYRVVCEPLTESGVAAFQSLRHLESLQIRGSLEMVDGEDLFAGLFAARPPLSGLKVESTPVSAAALRELGMIESLIFVSAVTREDFQGCQSMPNLLQFYLDFNGEIELSWLQDSPKLYALALKGPLFDEDLRQLAELKGLTYLSIIPSEFGGNITDAGIEHLTQLHDLKRIGLPADVINPTTVELLRRLPNLEDVDMFGPLPVRGPLRQSMREHWEVNHYLNGY